MVSPRLIPALLLLVLFASPAVAGEGEPFREVATEIGDYLLDTARKDGKSFYWAQYEGPGPDAMGEERRYPVSLYAGLTGTGWFLLDLHEATGEERFLDAASRAGLRLLDTAEKGPGGSLSWQGETDRKGRAVPDGNRVGLYTGNAGIGLFLFRLARETKKPLFLRGAEGAFRRITNEAKPEGDGLTWLYSFRDIIGGEAGIGLGLLAAHRYTGDDDLREAALAAATTLRACATVTTEGLNWEKRGYVDPNFSHGAAGIAFFLACTGHAEDLLAARQAAAWIESVAQPAGKDGIHWQYYAGDPPEGRRNWVMTSWCHGVPGTVRLFLLLHRVTGEERYLDTALRAGRGLRADTGLDAGTPRFANPTLCCGAAGCIEAFCDLAVESGDRQWLDSARSLAEAALAGMTTVGGKRVHALFDDSDREAKEHPYVRTGRMLGNAGFGGTLLRLSLLLDGGRDDLPKLPDHPRGLPVPEAPRSPTPRKPVQADPPEKPLPPAPQPTVGFPGYDALRTRAQRIWAVAPEIPAARIVLVPDSSPLAAAAAKLARHQNAEVLPFDPTAPEESVETLIRKGARYVTLFVTPEEMDGNLLREMIVLSALMDDDPFCDFAFGFFTGATRQEVGKFVDRSIAADKRGVTPRTLNWAVSNLSRHYKGMSFIQGMPGDGWYTDLGDLDHARMGLAEAADAGFIHLGGCGDPEGVWFFDDHRNLEPEKHWPFDPKKVGQDPKDEMPRILASPQFSPDLHSVHSGTAS